MMSEERFKEIKRIEAAAWPGPWTVGEVRAFAGHEWDCIVRGPKQEPVASMNLAGWGRKTSRANTAFAADARSAVPELLAEVDRLKDGTKMLMSANSDLFDKLHEVTKENKVLREKA